MGVAAAIFVLNIPCRFFKLVTPALLIVSAIMLLWVLCFGEKTNDAGRWISFFGLQFQPSEIAKGTLVLVTAQILSAMQREDGADKRAFKFILWVVIPFIILIGLENLSTAALIMVVIFLMMFIGRVPFVQLGKMMAGGALVIVLFIGLVYMAGSMESNDEAAETQTESVANGKTEKSTKKGPLHRFATWKNRIDKKLNSKYVAPQDYDLDKDAQVEQLPRLPRARTGADAGHSGFVQHDGGCGHRSGDGTAVAAHLQRRYFDHHQLCVYRCYIKC